MKSSPASIRTRLLAATPLLVLPLLTALFANNTRRWVVMWMIGTATFAGCKWLTHLLSTRRHAPLMRHLGYVFAWPGLNADAFLDPASAVEAVKPSEWITGMANVAFGLVLLGVGIVVVDRHPFVAGWLAMIDIVLTLHFGIFLWFSCGWRMLGVDAVPIMRRPLRSRSIGEFWGQRWNSAFRDITHRYLFTPLTRRLGVRPAILVGFLISGIVHELVITLPARAAFGLPTLYFLIQAAAMLLERGAPFKRMRGRIWTIVIVATPVPLLLFPPVFVHRVIVPMLTDFRTLIDP